MSQPPHCYFQAICVEERKVWMEASAKVWIHFQHLVCKIRVKLEGTPGRRCSHGNENYCLHLCHDETASVEHECWRFGAFGLKITNVDVKILVLFELYTSAKYFSRGSRSVFRTGGTWEPEMGFFFSSCLLRSRTATHSLSSAALASYNHFCTI